MENTKLENKAIGNTPENKTEATKVEIKEEYEKKISNLEGIIKDKDAEKLKLEAELNSVKDKYDTLKEKTEGKKKICNVEYITDFCGIKKGYKCKMHKNDAEAMKEKKIIKIIK